MACRPPLKKLHFPILGQSHTRNTTLKPSYKLKLTPSETATWLRLSQRLSRASKPPNFKGTGGHRVWLMKERFRKGFRRKPSSTPPIFIFTGYKKGIAAQNNLHVEEKVVITFGIQKH